MFQCSSASRKFLTENEFFSVETDFGVSVLFSEPKIPHPSGTAAHLVVRQRFSALQRAENSSPLRWTRIKLRTDARFSALQRAENSSPHITLLRSPEDLRFSALQRAENSSP